METQDRTPQDVSDGVEASHVSNRPYELTDLPFVRADERGVLNFWAGDPSGNDRRGRARGFEWAREGVAVMDQLHDHPGLLISAVQGMVAMGRFSPLEWGFVEAIGIATVELHNALRCDLVKPGLFGKPIVYPGYIAPKHGHYDRPPGRIHAQDSGEND